MVKTYEESLRAFEELFEKNLNYDEVRNEDTTRFHLIDTILIDCLAWDKSDIKTEVSYDGQYCDYIFNTVRNIMILEAKKEGDYFDLPVGYKAGIRSIKVLCKENANLKKAIEQVLDYSLKRGVPYSIVSNGHQFVAFIAARNDGVPPLDGKAIVFPSLEYIKDNFLEFWNSLSKYAVSENRISQILIDSGIINIPSKLATKISDYPGFQIRNVFQADIQTLSELVLDDVIKSQDIEKQFLIKCYCKSGALSQYSLLSKEILNARYKYLFEGFVQTPVVDRDGINLDIFAEGIAKRPILLIGDTGVGKTTFIKNLIKVEGEEIFKNAITLYLNLGTEGVIYDSLKNYIIVELTRQLIDIYDIDIEEDKFVRGIYHFELQKFKKGIYGKLEELKPDEFLYREIEFLEDKIKNKVEHLKHSLIHISNARRKQIVIFLDNTDQRSTEIQQEAFLISQEFSENWPVTIFLTLRPETFHLSLQTGVLTGYHPKAFTISPPRIDLVLEKRLKFALEITKGEIPISSFGERIGIKLFKLNALIEIFLYSLEKNQDLLRLIENVAYGNIRSAINIVKQFFGSGHINTEKIVTIYENSGSYIIPIHEFLRAYIYGDNKYFDPDSSEMVNVLDIHYNDPREHFVVPYLLGLLNTIMKRNKDEGYVEITTIYEHLQKQKYTPQQIDFALIKCLNKNLIETSDRVKPINSSELPKSVRIASFGSYHILELMNNFVYYDAIVIDTPIFEDSFREKILNVHDIQDRLKRCGFFIEYLDKFWDNTLASDSFFDWNICSQNVKEHMKQIENRIK
jgi:GTPase SAR1 family protein